MYGEIGKWHVDKNDDPPMGTACEARRGAALPWSPVAAYGPWSKENIDTATPPGSMDVGSKHG